MTAIPELPLPPPPPLPATGHQTYNLLSESDQNQAALTYYSAGMLNAANGIVNNLMQNWMTAGAPALVTAEPPALGAPEPGTAAGMFGAPATPTPATMPPTPATPSEATVRRTPTASTPGAAPTPATAAPKRRPTGKATCMHVSACANLF